MDQKLSLSSHILDTTKGKPAENVEVKLFKLVGGIWVESSSNQGTTDKDGRIKNFKKVDGSVNGVYKLRFEVAEYFQRLGQETLYPFIEVRLSSSLRIKFHYNCVCSQISFNISSDSHYHIPLLLNPFGYSTYRGS